MLVCVEACAEPFCLLLDSPRKRARLDPPSQDRPAFHAVPGPFPGHGAEGPKEKIEPGLYSRPLELPRGQYQAPLQPQVCSRQALQQDVLRIGFMAWGLGCRAVGASCPRAWLLMPLSLIA